MPAQLTPTLDHITPAAALPGGELQLHGTGLGPGLHVSVSGVEAAVTLARATRATVRIAEGTLPGEILAMRTGAASNPLGVSIAVPMAENLHPVANPAVDRGGNVYTTLSGARGQATPVSIFKVLPAAPGQTHELRPFVRDLLNPTGLAISPVTGDLYVSSRAEGVVYRITPAGIPIPFAEGLGIATGLAFDSLGDLYVGDRSGTIFKIRMPAAGEPMKASADQPTFVFATLEPSIAAYHLAFSPDDTLFVTGPTMTSSQCIHAIDRTGAARVFYRGLGRPQGLAFNPADPQANLYVAASLSGDRGILRITPGGVATLAISGPNLIGLCFLPRNRVALTTRTTLFELDFSPLA